MILATVGTQLPFDRLIRMLDDIAPTLDESILAQIGKGAWQPRNMEWTETLSGARYDAAFAQARVIVSHAGIGTVLRADQSRKPLILLPRLASYKEHRDNHQVDTCERLAAVPGVHVARDGGDIAAWLRQSLPPVDLSAHGAERAALIANLQSFLSSL